MSPVADLVIPTSGRPSLERLLSALGEELESAETAVTGRIIVVDDRRENREQPLLPDGLPQTMTGRVEAVGGPARGPAAARNAGWRGCRAEWVVFLDDDVVPESGWLRRLAEDLGSARAQTAGVQGRIRVPLPGDRNPTDFEREVRGLEDARWITADMAYRRDVLAELDGFDERFPRAFREDADLGLRVTGAGYEIHAGTRLCEHPVGHAGPLISLRRQAGNADDVLMRGLHGPGWRGKAGVSRGRRPQHLAATACGVAGLFALLCRRRAAGLAGFGLYLAGVSELSYSRIFPGPKTPAEISKMLLTSAVMPPLASYHWLSGLARHRKLFTRPTSAQNGKTRPEAVLFDRDGTLIEDVPYNGSAGKVRPAPGSALALSRLREAGIPTAVISNQSGVGRGLISAEQLEEVNRRTEELLGPLGPWAICPHGPDDGCTCRKPAPGLIFEAAARLGVDPARCAVVGDIGSDVEAARAAGARAVLVPTPRTRREEVAAAPEVARSLTEAVSLLLDGNGSRR